MDPKIIAIAASLNEENSHKSTLQEKPDLDKKIYSLTKENLSKLDQLEKDDFLSLTTGNLSRHNQKEPGKNVPIHNISASNVSGHDKGNTSDGGYCNIS
jgi:hypothetical protein